MSSRSSSALCARRVVLSGRAAGPIGRPVSETVEFHPVTLPPTGYAVETPGAAKFNNERKDMLNSEKRKVERCADGSVGRCIMPLTQEALANPKAAARALWERL